MQKLKFPNGTECYSRGKKKQALTAAHWTSLVLLAVVMGGLKLLPWIIKG